MRVLGLDLGDRRVGVAVSDDGEVLATPYDTIKRVGDQTVEHQRLFDLVDETGAEMIVVGVPYSLDGSIGPAAQKILAEVRSLEKKLRTSRPTVALATQDERFTTITAAEELHRGGTSRRNQRDRIDAAAAAVLLQSWLDGRH